MFWWRRGNGREVTINMTVVAFMDGEAVNTQFQWKTREGNTIRQVFRELDRKGPLGKRYFSRILDFQRPPTVLLNGDRLNVPEDLNTKKVNEGDEISVLMPIAGG